MAIADATAVAWLLALPAAALGALLVAVLGPPLGQLLAPAHPPFTYWLHNDFVMHPEPTEQARYLLAIAIPPLYALAVALTARAAPRVPAWTVTAGVPLAQALALLGAVACVLAQWGVDYGEIYTSQPGVSLSRDYFTPATLVVACAIAAAIALVLHDPRASARYAALTRESRGRRIAALALAAALTAIWLLHAVNSDRSISIAVGAVRDHVEYQLNETFAVLNGRTPLVDFTSQYGSLWPFPIALSLVVFGKTLLAFTITSAAITGTAMLAVFGVLRRVARSSVTALLLFLPFLATSFFTISGGGANRYTFGAYFGVFPLRYAGPFLLAWLVARRLELGERARTWPLFVVAGLVILNNAEFGVPALAATVAALVWTMDDLRPRPLLRLLGTAAAGLAAAFALVALLTLVRTGSLPQLGRLVEFARVFAVGGFGLLPLPGVLGLHLAIYLTYAAAIGAGTVRAIERAPNRVLTGMLVWSGIFGLGAASYYMGRSHPDSLISTFSAWSLAVALLTVHGVQRVAASPTRRPGPALVAVLVAFGIAVCSLAQTPAPWSQLERIRTEQLPTLPISKTPLLPDPATRDFFASVASGSGSFEIREGAPVAILVTGGHRIAEAFGVVNVSPYSGLTSAVTEEQLENVIDALRAAGGTTLIMPMTANEDYLVLARAGFRYVTASGLRRYDGASLPPDDVEVVFPDDTLTAQWLYLPATKWVLAE